MRASFALSLVLASSTSCREWSRTADARGAAELLALFVASSNPDVIAPASTWVARYAAFKREVEEPDYDV